LQINLKGLDGLQGPVYVGTGCVFRRQALYGYDPPAKDVKTKKAAMANFCLDFCCGPRKTRKKMTSLGKVSAHKKNAPSRTDSSIPIFTLEDIEEGLEGTKISLNFCISYYYIIILQVIFEKFY